MKSTSRQIWFGAILILLSVWLYCLHFLIFRDAHHIWVYLIGDLAFLPVDVLIVTMIIHQLLVRQEKRNMLNKLNMVIGVFYSETGNELLRRLSGFSAISQETRDLMKPDANWSDDDFGKLLKRVAAVDPQLSCARGDLKDLRAFLLARRDSLMRFLENPNLMEHETFTDVLWGVVHLTEELVARDLAQPPADADAKHLDGDMKRAYKRTVVAWVEYMRHLKTAYPYLFSLAVRQNPFAPAASVVVT